MPWTTPETFTAGQTLTAASMNAMTANDQALYDRTGLVLITPTSVNNGTLSGAGVSYSSAANVTVNGVFSATYTNYLVMIRITSCSGSGYVTTQLATGGTPSGASSYRWRLDEQYLVSGTDAAYRTTANTYWMISYVTTGTMLTDIALSVRSPFASEYTTMTHEGIYTPSSANNYRYFGGGSFEATTSFDGFRLFPPSGTFTGTLRVYGMTL